MKAYITSIGEPTTELCDWSLKRLGFETVVLEDKSSLWNKLSMIFDVEENDLLRVDADTMVNKNVLELVKQTELWWYQALTFDWFKQDTTHGGVQFIRQPAFSAIKSHIKEAERMERPESYLSRLEEFHNPRTFSTFEKICGINGYGQEDITRIKLTKFRRNQQDNYDFELAERISAL